MMTMVLRSRRKTFVESDSLMHDLCAAIVQETAETLSHTADSTRPGGQPPLSASTSPAKTGNPVFA